MRFPKPARWALGIVLVFAALKGGCEIAEEIVEHRWGHDDGNVTPTSPNQRRIHSEIGRGRRVYTGDPKEKALSYLRLNAGRLGLKPNLDDLNIVDARSNPFGDNVEVQQFFDKRPVENARLQVNFDREGHVVHVVSSYTPPVNVSDQIAIAREQVENIGRQEFSRTTPIYASKVDAQDKSRAVQIAPADIKLAEPIKVEDVYFARKEQLRRAYKTYIHATNPFGVKQVVIDAYNGDVLQVNNFVYDAVDGNGQVLSNDALPSASPTLYVTVQLPQLDASSGGPFRLRGPYVVLENVENPPPVTLLELSTPDFVFDQTSPNFGDVMVYHHIDSMQRYIQAPLGFMNIVNRPLKADAHGLGGGDDSRYVSSPETPGQGYLAFGGGPVDDAQDADVIAHEYGHAIQDNQTLGKYAIFCNETLAMTTTCAETMAMSEGFGDYWALSTSSTYKTAKDGSVNDPACLMEWDHITCLRSISLFKFKDDFVRTASAHVNGLIWSATLFHIFKLLDRETADRLILQSHFNIPRDPNFEQGADAILGAALQLKIDNKIPALCEVFQKHKIYAAGHCPSVSLPSGSEP